MHLRIPLTQTAAMIISASTLTGLVACNQDDSPSFFDTRGRTITLDVPADLIVDCPGGDPPYSLTAWLDSATATTECDTGRVTLTSDFTGLEDNCADTVTWTVTDDCGQSASATAEVSIIDRTSPELEITDLENITVECGRPDLVTGLAVSDTCDLDPTIVFEGDTFAINTPGLHRVDIYAIDACGNRSESTNATVAVVDTLPPEVETENVELWPPNGRQVSMTLSECVTVTDACDGPIDIDAEGRILSIYSDEPENDNGDGNTTGDIQIDGDASFTLRAERRGGSDGRVYGVTFEVYDHAGNRTEATCLIQVPHDQSGDSAVDSGRQAGYEILVGR